MKKNLIDAEAAKLAGLQIDLLQKIRNGKITIDDFEKFLNQKNELPSSVMGITADWQKFYQEVFNLKVDFSQTIIPNNTNTKLNFLQFMPQGLTYSQVHDKEKSMYPKYWDWNDNWPNEMSLDFEERKTDQNYAIWHSGLAEVEDDYADKTSNWILSHKIKTMTRLERGVFGLYMLWKHNIIIDRRFITYCTGSRDSGGRVPGAGWSGDGFASGWIRPDGHYDHWRPRPVVS